MWGTSQHCVAGSPGAAAAAGGAVCRPAGTSLLLQAPTPCCAAPRRRSRSRERGRREDDRTRFLVTDAEAAAQSIAAQMQMQQLQQLQQQQLQKQLLAQQLLMAGGAGGAPTGMVSDRKQVRRGRTPSCCRRLQCLWFLEAGAGHRQRKAACCAGCEEGGAARRGTERAAIPGRWLSAGACSHRLAWRPQRPELLPPAPAACARPQREVYIGNLAIGIVTQDVLRDFFNQVFAHKVRPAPAALLRKAVFYTTPQEVWRRWWATLPAVPAGVGGGPLLACSCCGRPASSLGLACPWFLCRPKQCAPKQFAAPARSPAPASPLPLLPAACCPGLPQMADPQATPPVVNINMDTGGRFAFVELRTEDLAKEALQMDKIVRGP